LARVVRTVAEETGGDTPQRGSKGATAFRITTQYEG
jgi:hypothetical protein